MSVANELRFSRNNSVFVIKREKVEVFYKYKVRKEWFCNNRYFFVEIFVFLWESYEAEWELTPSFTINIKKYLIHLIKTLKFDRGTNIETSRFIFCILDDHDKWFVLDPN
jgi:hypothetical protein